MKFLDLLRKRHATLLEQRDGLLAELESITEAAATEQRDLKPDESTRANELIAEVQALDDPDADDSLAAVERRIGELEVIDQRQRAAAAAVPFHINRDRDPFDLSDLRYGATKRDLHQRAMAALDVVDGLEADEREAAARSLRRFDNRHGALARRMLVTGRPEYRSAFEKVLAGDEYGLNDGERAALSAMRAASLTDAQGGYAVPFTLDPTVIHLGDGSVNPLRRISTVKTTVTDQWAGPTVGQVEVSWDGEAVEVSDDAPTLAQPSIPVHKAQGFIPYSIELGMDWAGAEGEFRSLLAEAKDDAEAIAFVTGTGTGQPRGIITALTGTAAEVPPRVAETFSEDDVLFLEGDLPAKHRDVARWLADRATYNVARQFTTPLVDNLAAGLPPSMVGHPMEETSAMDRATDINAAAAGTNRILAFGDFRYYYVIDRIGLVVDLIPHLFGPNQRPTGQRGLYAYWRTGADVIKPTAFRMLNVTTAV